MSAPPQALTLSPKTPPAGAHPAQPAGDGLSLRVAPPSEWERISAGFDGTCQEQTYAFAATRWPRVTLEPVLFQRDGVAVGGALMILQPLPLGMGTIALTKWGPMLADATREHAESERKAMVEALIAEYAERRGTMLSIVLKAAPEPRFYAWLRERGFAEGSTLEHPDRYLVDVKLDDADRMAAFSQKWRAHLRKAQKEELVFEHAGADQLDAFMELYRAMTARKQFPDYSAIQTLEALMAMPADAARPELFFVHKDGVCVAGAVIFARGDTATYLYGATNDAALKLRAGYFLHWHIIRWLRENTGARWYDLGGTDGFQGLHQFKHGMVGSAGFIAPIPPMANYAATTRMRMIGGLAYGARDALTGVRQWLVARRSRAEAIREG